jgi:putative transposase
MKIFTSDEDYVLFEKVLEEAKEKFDMRVLSYQVMPNHWHLVLYPKNDGDLQRFTGWLSMTHTQRWHSQHKTIGSGHLYQGRYKSFPVQTNAYLLRLFRYVERNALRAKLVKKAENWKWSSLYRREEGTAEQKKLLSKWPIDMPMNYLALVNEPQTNTEVESLRYSVNKGKPYGVNSWVDKMINTFKLGATLRNPGRPKKGS